MAEPCPTCGAHTGHKGWCPAGGRGPVGDPSTRDKSKQNFPKRPDDGRKKR